MSLIGANSAPNAALLRESNYCRMCGTPYAGPNFCPACGIELTGHPAPIEPPPEIRLGPGFGVARGGARIAGGVGWPDADACRGRSSCC